jgi:hypothetical protein
MTQFLDPESIADLCAYSGVDEAARDALFAVAARIRANEKWLAAATHLRDAAYGPERRLPPEADVIATFGDETPLVALLLSLESSRLIRAAQRARGVPEAIVRANCRDTGVGVQRYRAKTGGRVGMDYWLLGWCGYISGGDLYLLGRMQFMPRAFDGPIHVFRNRGDGRILALSVADVRFDAEGFCVPDDAPDAWTATFAEDEATVTGHPISPHGFAVREPVTLGKAEWARVFGPGDPVLEMHIPDAEPFTRDVLRASFEQALDFFPRHYPQHAFKAFVCESWIFNTQLREMLGPQSNLVAFQREGYLFPIPGDLAYIVYFIFGERHIDLATAPRDTRLRRAVLDALAAGQHLRHGGFFLLRDDVARFGQQPYQDTRHQMNDER